MGCEKFLVYLNNYWNLKNNSELLGHLVTIFHCRVMLTFITGYT
jgi:hypothetical protein